MRWVQLNRPSNKQPKKVQFRVCRVRVWRISGFCGYGDSVGIPTGFSVGMGLVWALKFNPHGSPNTKMASDGADVTCCGRLLA